MGKLSPTGGDTAAQGGALISGSFVATGVSANAPLYGSFNVSIWGTFSGTVQLLRSFDGGTTWLPCSADIVGDTVQFTAPYSGFPWAELEHAVLYQLDCTAYVSGTINYRVSQTSDFVFVGGLSR